MNIIYGVICEAVIIVVGFLGTLAIAKVFESKSKMVNSEGKTVHVNCVECKYSRPREPVCSTCKTGSNWKWKHFDTIIMFLALAAFIIALVVVK